MALVIQDYGHGKQRDPGATYKGRTESDDVLKLGKKVTTILKNNGVKVIETRKGNEFVSLIERSRISNRNNADIFVSYHRNAFNGKAKGAETFTYPRSSARSVRLAKAIQRTLVGVGFVDRGHKTKNLSVLRETKAPAVLIEAGFIDNPGDNKIFDNNLDKMADGIAKDILKELGIKYKPKKTPTRNYVKQGDKGSNIINIKQLQKDLLELGYGVGDMQANGHFGSTTDKYVRQFQKDTAAKVNGAVGPKTLGIIKEMKNNKDLFYRTVTGSFKNREEAEKRIKELKEAGFDSFIDSYKK